MWQALRTELHPYGVEIVTVALDVDADAPVPFIEAAQPEHPSLIDQAHLVDELFGMVNVPNAVWIDERGTIVRPAEPAQPGPNPVTNSFRTMDLSKLEPDIAQVLGEARKIRIDPEAYVAMVRDWAEHGSNSRFALSADEVIHRSRRRGPEAATAAAHFELGQHLHHNGDHDAAVAHWREAHRLDPDNWTYRRNAWNFEDPVRQGHTSVYDSSWYEDVVKIGAENYYPPLQP